MPHQKRWQRPGERARIQGANDFLVFTVMGVSSLSSGALVSSAGWQAMNWTGLAVLGVVSAVIAYLARLRHHQTVVAA